MTAKSKLTSSEWQLLRDGPEWVFAALAAADGNVALTTKVKESKAFKGVMKDASAGDELVRAVVSDPGKPAKEIKGATLSEAEQAVEEINAVLNAKLSLTEAAPYRSFLNGIADSVASAAGEGALGLGEKVSKNEEKAITKIKAALKPAPAVKVSKPAAAAPVRPAARPAAPVPPKPSAKTVKPARPAASAPAPKPAVRKEAAHADVPDRSQRPDARAMSSTQAQTQAQAASAAAAETAFIAEHTVASGETLSHISLKYYSSAAKPKYMLIYEANKDVIGDNPNRILPGMVLKIPKLES